MHGGRSPWTVRWGYGRRSPELESRGNHGSSTSVLTPRPAAFGSSLRTPFNQQVIPLGIRPTRGLIRDVETRPFSGGTWHIDATGCPRA